MQNDGGLIFAFCIMWTWVLCLLCCFLTGSLGVETTDPLAFDIKFDQDGYDCEAQLAHAVLSIIAMGAGSGGAKISLTSVMDISRSMNDTASTALNAPTHTKLELLQKTNDYVVQTLALESEVHKFGVVTFAKEVEEIVPLTTLEKDSVERIQAAINGIRPVFQKRPNAVIASSDSSGRNDEPIGRHFEGN